MNNLYVRFVPLEPKTLSRLDAVHWIVETSARTVEGDLDAAVPLIVEAPVATEDITRLTLMGTDTAGRLRAYGTISGVTLAAATQAAPAPLRFALIDEFQAYSASVAAPLLEHLVYVDTAGRVVTVAGNDGSARNVVDAFDPLTGQLSTIGTLGYHRSAFGSSPTADGRFILVGGIGDAGATVSAEVWNPSTSTAQTLDELFGSTQGRLTTPRPMKPSVIEVEPLVFWVIDGMEDPAAPEAPAEIVDLAGSTGWVPSTTAFGSLYGDLVFAKQIPATSEFEFFRWGGDDDAQFLAGQRYVSNAVGPVSIFSIPVTSFSYPRVLVGDLTVFWGVLSGQSSRFICENLIVTPSGTNPSQAVAPALPDPSCDPAMTFLDSDTVLAVGGVDSPKDSGPLSTVWHVDVQVGGAIFTVPTTPDGRLQRLVYPRRGAEVVRLADDTVVVVGGSSDGANLPRFEIRQAAPPR